MLTALDLNFKLANLLAMLSQLISKPVYFIANIKIINRFNLSGYVLITLLFICPLSSLFAQAKDNTGDLLVAEFAINNNDLPKALDIYEKIALETKDPQICKRAAELAISLGDSQRAIKTVILWADTDKTSSKAQLAASLLLMQFGDFNQAHGYLKQLFEISDMEAYPSIELLLNHPFNEQKQTALRQLLEQINVELKNSSHLYLVQMALASFYEKANDGAASLALVNKVISVKPDWTQAHMQKTKLLSLYKSADEAIKYLNHAVVQYPQQYELRKLYADILYDMEKFDLAQTHYAILAKNAQFESEALLQLAHINLAKNDLKTAGKHLQKLNLNPAYTELARYYLGIIAEQLGDNTKALNYFKDIPPGEYALRGLVRAATILFSQNKANEANLILQSAYNSENIANIKNTILAEVQLMYDQGLNQDALAVLKNMEIKYPNDVDIKYSIGILAKKMNNIELFEKNMSFVLKENPDNSNALSALGWHYFTKNNNEKALELLKQAFAHDDTNSTNVGARLGAVLWAVGQYDQANLIWKKMIELDPYNEALRDIIKKYQK